MRAGALVLAFVAMVLGGCESPGGPQRLVADLQAMLLPAALGKDFDGQLLGGDGTTVCVGNKSVQVYRFPDADAATKAAASVNRNDPSFVGHGIVEWIGPPRFWLRDEAIVVYVGDDDALDAALRTILGRPFAEKAGFEGRALPDRFQRDCELA